MSAPKVDEKYSFKIRKGNDKNTYFFKTNKNGCPYKLGDGTYGIVYKVCNADNEEFAVKLLYMNKTFAEIEIAEDVSSKATISHNEILQSSSLKRFKFEMESAKRINRMFKSKNKKIEGIVNIIGGSSDFCESDAYKNLRPYFRKMNVEVSNYALVMPLYDCTLKDILEGGIGKFKVQEEVARKISSIEKNKSNEQILSQLLKETSISKPFQSKETFHKKIDEILSAAGPNKSSVAKIKKLIHNGVYELRGYDVLESMDYVDRISNILPYLYDIASGLRVLHSVKLGHYDMKPANIFINAYESGKVKAFLGDLGFLNQKNDTSSSARNIQDDLPLGTRHYRSPEQKDYSDVCELEVNHIKEGLLLNIRDPKFSDSIIEKNDCIVFSKDPERMRYPINNIQKRDELITVEILGRHLKEKISQDKCTQAYFYKNQGIRTDLFGFGAILFDMLTCGKSPEQFYDYVKAYDNEHTDINRIMDIYDKVSSYESNERDTTILFSYFKNKFSEYAPSDIVRIVFKTMFYKAKGTYYQESEEPHRATEALFKDVDEQAKSEKFAFTQARLSNKLVKKELEPLNSAISKKMSDILKGLYSETNILIKFSQGIWYFERLVELIQKNISDDERKYTFAEMVPDNITLVENSNALKFEYYSYTNQKSFFKDLREDQYYTKITRNISNPFVPNQISYMRRPIDLIQINDNVFSYSFTDASYFGDYIKEDDWIVFNENAYKVTDVIMSKTLNKKIRLISSGPNKEIRLEDEYGEKYDCFYYRNIEPSYYYLYMLGTYLYQIFFVGTIEKTIDKPVLVNILENVHYLNDLNINIRLKKIRQNKYLKGDPIKKLFQNLIHMYLKLILLEHENSYFKTGKSSKERMVMLLTDISDIKAMIASVVGVKTVELNRLVESDSQSSKLTIEEFDYTYNFNELIKSCVKISPLIKTGIFQFLFEDIVVF